MNKMSWAVMTHHRWHLASSMIFFELSDLFHTWCPSKKKWTNLSQNSTILATRPRSSPHQWLTLNSPFTVTWNSGLHYNAQKDYLKIQNGIFHRAFFSALFHHDSFNDLFGCHGSLGFVGLHDEQSPQSIQAHCLYCTSSSSTTTTTTTIATRQVWFGFGQERTSHNASKRPSPTKRRNISPIGVWNDQILHRIWGC